MQYDISFINDTDPTETYDPYQLIEETGQQLFEGRWCSPQWQKVNQCGLVVYVNAGNVAAVYDYENLCGWLV